MGKVVAIIPARYGSKGIPGKNLVPLCGKPLLAWSIEQANTSSKIDSVWVTSDSTEILEVAERYGAHAIERPTELSGDIASSESAWLHAMDVIENTGMMIDCIVGMQATSPIRESTDLDSAIKQFDDNSCDSMLSVGVVEDFFFWHYNSQKRPESINYDYRNRQPRQLIEKRYLENGSFYIFKPNIIRSHNNRLGGNIGLYVMEHHKMFQIDTPSDIKLCQVIMYGYGLDK